MGTTGSVQLGLLDGDRWTATTTTTLVDQTVMGDHEHPGPERGLVPTETVDTPGDMEPGLTHEIIDIDRSLTSHVSTKRPIDLPHETGPGPFAPCAGGIEYGFERLWGRHLLSSVG